MYQHIVRPRVRARGPDWQHNRSSSRSTCPQQGIHPILSVRTRLVAVSIEDFDDGSVDTALQLSAVRKELSDQTIILSSAGLSVPFAEVQISPVDGDNGLSCGLVAAIGRYAERWCVGHECGLHFTESGRLPDLVESQAALPTVGR